MIDYICWNSPKISHQVIFTVVEIVGITNGYCDIVYHTGTGDKHTAYDVPVNQLEIIKENNND